MVARIPAGQVATYGLVAGNVIGNPLARRRIKKLGLSSSDAAQVDHEALLELKKNTEGTAKLDVDRGTLALALIFLACGLGTLISMLFAKFNITLASYVGSMIIGIIIIDAAAIVADISATLCVSKITNPNGSVIFSISFSINNGFR